MSNFIWFEKPDVRGLASSFETIRLCSRAKRVCIAVSPVFSASYSGLFKSFIDVLDPKSLDGKAVLLGAPAVVRPLRDQPVRQQ